MLVKFSNSGKGQENRRNWVRRYEVDLCSFRKNQDAELTYVAEQSRLNDCYFDKKDWRSCKNEVGSIRLEAPQVTSITGLICLHPRLHHLKLTGFS